MSENQTLHFVLDKATLSQELFEVAYDPVFLLHQSHVIDCNKAAMKKFGIDNKENIIHLHPSQLSPQFQVDGSASEEKANQMIQACLNNGVNRFEWQHCSLDGEVFWAEVTLIKLKLEGHEIIHAQVRDIDSQKKNQAKLLSANNELTAQNQSVEAINNQLKQASDTQETLIDSMTFLNEYKKAMDASSIVSKADTFGQITYVNELFCQISGYTEQELVGQPHSIVRHPDSPAETFTNMWATIQNKEVWKGVLKNRTKCGKDYYVNTTIVPVLDSQGGIKEFIAIRQDITSLYERDEIISQQYTDSLTGLKNRIKLKADIQTLPLPKLAILNIDRFKEINDSYGQEVGDLVLIEFAHKLNLLNSHNIHIYHYSGDAFAILAFGNYSLKELEELCQEILSELDQQNLMVAEDAFNISVSIGLAEGNKRLLASVEMALSHAKARDLDLVVFNDDLDMRTELRDNIEWTKRIKFAIQNQRVLLYGQKIINNITGKEKFETLMRIESETGEIIAPGRFLEHAKRARLYPILTRMMIDQACTYFQNKPYQFSLNLTIQDILNTETVNFLFKRLEETNTFKQVIIELVESEGIESHLEIYDFIAQIKSLGGLIAIDDFGTGYSNFEYLTKIDADLLKIDGSLIRNMHQDPNTLITVKTIVSFAKALNIKVVAEFVHCLEVQNLVLELGIELSQGYFLHEPELLRDSM
ncbi:bifunctional diguanylate cyclase/phosphodiesterase [Thiomicrorhabdus sp. Kp2]|uniref:sensor domain-containing protein n=1 Tax=Thiomicrorhabdus sp. Kp2 TaxID=1123518 RepID=UPI00040D35B2|nr:EAL domain-containing protein [Thiomicrorhabdus sp. Kp2]